MDHVLKKYCPRIEFDSYEDFAENFTIEVPEAFNFGFDVVDEWAAVEPDKRALLWTNDAGEERTFTFTDIKHLSNQAANAFKELGIGKATWSCASCAAAGSTGCAPWPSASWAPPSSRVAAAHAQGRGLPRQ